MFSVKYIVVLSAARYKAFMFIDYIALSVSDIVFKYFCVQVESLTRKAQLQEVELERTTTQLKEAIAIAGEETAKCKAAKEVIKSLTAQVRKIILYKNLDNNLHVCWYIFSVRNCICFLFFTAQN